MDVIAITTIYHWVSAPVGLVIAAVIGGGGLTLADAGTASTWLLVLVPLIVLAPIVSDGITMLLIAFMIAISAASLLVQLGKDWVWLHAARITAPTFPSWLRWLPPVSATPTKRGRPVAAQSPRARHGRRAGPAAVDRQPDRDGAADRRRHAPGAVRIRRVAGYGRCPDGRRAGRCATCDRARRGPLAGVSKVVRRSGRPPRRCLR